MEGDFRPPTSIVTLKRSDMEGGGTWVARERQMTPNPHDIARARTLGEFIYLFLSAYKRRNPRESVLPANGNRNTLEAK